MAIPSSHELTQPENLTTIQWPLIPGAGELSDHSAIELSKESTSGTLVDDNKEGNTNNLTPQDCPSYYDLDGLTGNKWRWIDAGIVYGPDNVRGTVLSTDQNVVSKMARLAGRLGAGATGSIGFVGGAMTSGATTAWVAGAEALANPANYVTPAILIGGVAFGVISAMAANSKRDRLEKDVCDSMLLSPETFNIPPLTDTGGTTQRFDKLVIEVLKKDPEPSERVKQIMPIVRQVINAEVERNAVKKTLAEISKRDANGINLESDAINKTEIMQRERVLAGICNAAKERVAIIREVQRYNKFIAKEYDVAKVEAAQVSSTSQLYEFSHAIGGIMTEANPNASLVAYKAALETWKRYASTIGDIRILGEAYDAFRTTANENGITLPDIEGVRAYINANYRELR